MTHHLLVMMAAGMLAAPEAPPADVDLDTAMRFHERLASVCREYGLRAGYGGHMAYTGWPLGVRVGPPKPDHSLSWLATSGQGKSELRRVLFMFVISPRPHADAVAVCPVQGKRLYLLIEHVDGGRGVDEPIPAWALSAKAQGSGVTVRKLLRQLGDGPPRAAPQGDGSEAARVGLHAVDLFHHRLATAANRAGWLCVYYRGPLAREPAVGRGGFRLPEAANSALTWTITNLDDTEHCREHLVCQVTVSLTKRADRIATYRAGGGRWYLGVSHLAGNRTADDPVPELARHGKTGRTMRAFLEALGTESKAAGE